MPDEALQATSLPPVYDTYGGYTWLFVGSFALGLGAVAVALAFPPLPRARLQPA